MSPICALISSWVTSQHPERASLEEAMLETHLTLDVVCQATCGSAKNVREARVEGTAHLELVCAWPARLELAVLTLVDDLVGASMADVAIPLDESSVGFDDIGGSVGAVCWGGHGGVM